MESWLCQPSLLAFPLQQRSMWRWHCQSPAPLHPQCLAHRSWQRGSLGSALLQACTQNYLHHSAKFASIFIIRACLYGSSMPHSASRAHSRWMQTLTFLKRYYCTEILCLCQECWRGMHLKIISKVLSLAAAAPSRPASLLRACSVKSLPA